MISVIAADRVQLLRVQLGPKRFQVGGIDLHGDTLHNHVYCQHNARVVLMAQDNAVHAGERTLTDSGFFADVQKGVRRGIVPVKAIAETLNFSRRQGHGPPAGTHDGQDPGGAQYACPIGTARMHEEIAGEQRHLEGNWTAVFPAAAQAIHREKMLDLSHDQMAGNLFLVTWTGINRVPPPVHILVLPNWGNTSGAVICQLRQSFAIPRT